MRRKINIFRDGDTRIKTKFLIFPRTLPTKDFKELEMRWLETVQISQVYRQYTTKDIWLDQNWEN